MAPLTLVVTDDCSECCTLHTCTDAACRVPYLHTMLATRIGVATGRRHEIVLPKGCTTQAFVSLLKRVDTVGEDLQTVWAASGAATVALICTADFLMLQELMPELVRHCKYVVKSPSEIKLLSVLRVTHPDVLNLVREFRTGPLAVTITVTQAKAISCSMAADYGSVCFATQAVALGQWMRHPERSAEDVTAVANHFGWNLLWDLRGGIGIPVKLKTGSLGFVSLLVQVAKDRPACFTVLIESVFKSSSRALDAELLIGAVVQSATNGTPLSPEQLLVVLEHAFKAAFVMGVANHLAPLYSGSTDEGKDALCTYLVASAQLPSVVTVELLQVLDVAQRASLVAQLLTNGQSCPPVVLAFISEAIADGQI